MKCTHDSGSIIICEDKNSFDRARAKSVLCKVLKKNYYWGSREWPYKNIAPRIIAERYLVDDNIAAHLTNHAEAEGLVDYKFYCFSGVPKFLYIGFANMKDGKKADVLSFFDLEFKPTPFYRKDHEPLPFEVKKPENFGEMIEVAKALSDGIPFVRVDMYNINRHILLSELTMFPGGGFGRFYPDEWEQKLGAWIKLPEVKT